MRFSCKCYLQLAEELISCSKSPDLSTEAYFRSSISRSYYGLFLIARQVMESEGFICLRGSEAHKQVQDHFLNSDDNNYQLVGTELQDLRRQRNKADYNLNCIFTRGQAELAHQRAKNNFEYLSGLLSE
ncbi:conserved hypothetical protein [Planktothrix serta PCC 8927]|uniref:HEPN domain-containing protein n=1 Tax=Planktothrix serta PCC 8927 TaxID=671068 RepID=A0A7Z9DUM9_9CYAN|nr:conserved hypothetical protein [Planktothrix serta PCC 8927]